jgi:hypothetical protein
MYMGIYIYIYIRGNRGQKAKKCSNLKKHYDEMFQNCKALQLVQPLGKHFSRLRRKIGEGRKNWINKNKREQGKTEFNKRLKEQKNKERIT